MGLRDKLNRSNGDDAAESSRLNKYGVVDNPFPSASQTQDHPHMEIDADNSIAAYVDAYDRSHSSQVLVIEGDQGTGKTNLLNYYEKEFKDLYPESEGFYIIRYYADPEPGFDKMLARILRELGAALIKKVAEKLSQLGEAERNRVVGTAKMHDMRTVLQSLSKTARDSPDELDNAAEAALEWVLGFRVFQRHRDRLGQIHFRLDTVESKTQALRDLVFCSAKLGVLKGLILLLDELEKMDDTTTKLTILRFLSAIRALIDALPKYLFLMAAMTPVALNRYFGMLPAFAGRLQNRIKLTYLKDADAALKLCHFYLKEEQLRATSKLGEKLSSTPRPIVSDKDAIKIFTEALKDAKTRGDEGVRQRVYLNELHQSASESFRSL